MRSTYALSLDLLSLLVNTCCHYHLNGDSSDRVGIHLCSLILTETLIEYECGESSRYRGMILWLSSCTGMPMATYC